MGKTLRYVKEFDFGPQKTYVKGYCKGGSAPKGYAEGGAADLKQDKQMIKAAVHKHERAMHPGKTPTKLARGGSANPTPMRESMVKREARETPTSRSETMAQRSKVVAPPMRAPRPASPRRTMPVAPASPLLAMKRGGDAAAAAKMSKVMGEYKEGTLHSGSKTGPKVRSRDQALAIALSQARKARK